MQLPFLFSHGMDHFLKDDGVVMSLSSWYKTCLIRINPFIHQWLETISNQLGYHLINKITEPNWPKLRNSFLLL